MRRAKTQKPQKDRSFWGFLGLAVKVGFEPESTPLRCRSLLDKTSKSAPPKATVLANASLSWLVISTLFRHPG
jgi:hypothetical protein